MENVIIMGAAGRDFHNYNMYFRFNINYRVIAFTASEQIPGISGRSYLGIPIYPESILEELIKKYYVKRVILAYSDLSHQEVMEKASKVLAVGADFVLMGPKTTMLESKIPVVAITAVRTGCGKSSVTFRIAQIFKEKGLKVVIVRHPMPYGNLKITCQRFETIEDLDKNKCTIEEREEYEHYIDNGFIVYAGIDYEIILMEAEKEADVILWDGGNNDLPFFKPNYHIVVTDPLRLGDELNYYPGRVNLQMADMVIINKVNTAPHGNIELIINNIRSVNKNANIIKSESIFILDVPPKDIEGKNVIVIEDGPTLTHGNMIVGAGCYAASVSKCHRVDIFPSAVGSIKELFEKYTHLNGFVLPAMGYNEQQRKDLEDTINNTECDYVLSATPIDISKVIKVNKPIVRVSYMITPERNFYIIMNGLEAYIRMLNKNKEK